MFGLRTSYSSLLMIISAAILWGTIGVTTQGIYTFNIPSSLFINLIRMAVATPLLTLICWRVVGRRMLAIRRRDLLLMALSGTLLAISHSTYFASIHYTGVTIATLLTICLAPVVVTVLVTLLGLETLKLRTLAALACAVLGSVLLVGFSGQSDQSDIWTGAVFALIAASTYGGMMVCNRLLAGSYHPLQVTTVMFGTGSLILLIVNAVTGFTPISSPQAWGLALYLGIFPTAAAYFLFQTGLRTVQATTASIISMIDPLVAAFLAWLLYQEALSVIAWAGAGLMVAGIVLATGREKVQADPVHEESTLR